MLTLLPHPNMLDTSRPREANSPLIRIFVSYENNGRLNQFEFSDQMFFGEGERLIHLSLVKSGKATGAEPGAMDCSDRHVTHIQLAQS